MPWEAQSGNVYNLCLLDTNVISEIIKYPTNEGKGFIEKFPPDKFVPCFTIYNIIEIERDEILFKKFINLFSQYPCFLLKPFTVILDEEVKCYQSSQNVSVLFNAFSPLGNNDSYNFEKFIEELSNKKIILNNGNSWRDEEKEILQLWLSDVDNFKPSKESPNSQDAERYIKKSALSTLERLYPEFITRIKRIDNSIDIDNFLSLKTMLYSLYYRLYDPSWSAQPSEVTDLRIIAATPYVDVIITEKFQANILNKIQNKVQNLDKLLVRRLKDIRIN